MEEKFRVESFKWIQEQVHLYGDVLPRSLLERGFEIDGQRINFVGAQGIWKPKGFEIPLSITTKFKTHYDDKVGEDVFYYSYRGTDPHHRDNIGLKIAMQRQLPLIYFFTLIPGKCLTIFPVFIVGDDPENLTFSVVADNVSVLNEYAKNYSPNLVLKDPGNDAVRRYITCNHKARLHQKAFREEVIHAYKERCAFCMLKHTNLLDAAHIIPDGEELGDPIIVNGMSLCKIHHAAFDENIIGVTPDYKIQVREDILFEIDGPMLKHGIQELNNRKLILPSSRNEWPDKARLEIKYGKFKGAV
jgi:putative restriction endonuclease